MFLMGKRFLGQFRIRKCNILSNVTSFKYRHANSTSKFYFHFVLILARAIAAHYEKDKSMVRSKKTYFQGVEVWEWGMRGGKGQVLSSIQSGRVAHELCTCNLRNASGLSHS